MSRENDSKKTDNEKNLLSFPLIVAAIQGDLEAISIIVNHYDKNINYLSTRSVKSENRTVYWDIDSEMYHCLRAHLIHKIQEFKI